MLMVIISVVIVILIIVTIWIWYHPETLLTPLNFLYKSDSSYRTNFYTDEQRDIIFPVGLELEAVWQDIKREGYELYETLPNKQVNYLDNYHMNIGDETKTNWTTIPLRLFGTDSYNYINRCPILNNILKSHPEIKSCLFSIMEPGKIIKPHVGPYDGLIRYQLALDIPLISYDSISSIGSPNVMDSLLVEECYLHVGGERYEWIEGKGVLFDESNLHGAVNTTKEKRMVLLIDIERPYSLLLYRIINKAIIWGMGSLPATQQALLI